MRIFLKKPQGFPGLDLANTRLSPGNLGVFSDFFQNSNEKWPKMNKKWLLECKKTFSIRLCKQKLIFELQKVKCQIFMFFLGNPGYFFLDPELVLVNFLYFWPK